MVWALYSSLDAEGRVGEWGKMQGQCWEREREEGGEGGKVGEGERRRQTCALMVSRPGPWEGVSFRPSRGGPIPASKHKNKLDHQRCARC
jgi:hypothetical protein